MALLPWYALPQYAQIGIISVTTIPFLGGQEVPTHDLRVEAEPFPDVSTAAFRIFFQPNISESQVGSTYTLDSGPVFQQTVDYLTNGRTGWLTFSLGVGGLGFTKNHFNGNYPGVDLMGFTIEGLDLSINSFRAWQGTLPGGQIFYDYEGAITFVIRGGFPLPRKWLHRSG